MSVTSKQRAEPPETGSGPICSIAVVDTSRVIACARDYPSGWIVGRHCHADGQFIHAICGVMEIRAERRLWLVPPGRAIWMPPRIAHEMKARGPVSLRTFYIPSTIIPDRLARDPAGYAVTPLVRELILRSLRDDDRGDIPDRRARRLAVLLEEVADLHADEIALPMPSDPRLARACDAVLADLGQERGMDDLANAAGASVRTLGRLARDELGCTLSVWRQQACVLAAVPLLVAGRSVMSTAQALGYQTPSAFAAIFRRFLGTTPRAFASQRSI